MRLSDQSEEPSFVSSGILAVYQYKSLGIVEFTHRCIRYRSMKEHQRRSFGKLESFVHKAAAKPGLSYRVCYREAGYISAGCVMSQEIGALSGEGAGQEERCRARAQREEALAASCACSAAFAQPKNSSDARRCLRPRELSVRCACPLPFTPKTKLPSSIP